MCTFGLVDTILKVSWEDFVATWVSLWAILGYVEAILGLLGVVLVATWVHLGAILGNLGPILASSGAFREALNGKKH